MAQMRWEWWAYDGVHGTCTSRRAACRALAEAIGRRHLRGLVTAGGGGGERYYYLTRAARDADDTGAHAWMVGPFVPMNDR